MNFENYFLLTTKLPLQYGHFGAIYYFCFVKCIPHLRHFHTIYIKTSLSVHICFFSSFYIKLLWKNTKIIFFWRLFQLVLKNNTNKNYNSLPPITVESDDQKKWKFVNRIFRNGDEKLKLLLQRYKDYLCREPSSRNTIAD